MAKKSPKTTEEKFERIINAWVTLAQEKSFGGMTLVQFEAECLPSKEARAEIEELQDKLTRAMAKRDAADKVIAAKMALVVAGVLGDPTEGPDSALYEAFGYTRQSERKSGLTRKGKKSGTS